MGYSMTQIQIPVRVLVNGSGCSKHNCCIELRTCFDDPVIQQEIIRALWYREPITILPYFSNELKGRGSLVTAKLIKFDTEKNRFFLNI